MIDPTNKTPKWLKLYYLLWIKWVDARHHCSFGTNLHAGAYFATPPNFPHGPNGIICWHDIKMGAHCNIYHQVTIKILPNVTIGNYCHVGASAVVVENMPDYSTCVMQKLRIILRRLI